MQAQRVTHIKARVAQLLTRTAQVEAEIERGQTERDQLRGALTEAEAELKEAVDAPVEGGVDPTEWLPNELLLIIFAHLNYTVLGRCGRVCRRWHGLYGLKAGQAAIVSRRWAYSKGRETPTEWKGHTSTIWALVISNVKLFSASLDNTIRVWSLKDGKCVQILTGHTKGVNGLAVGSDGTLYSASDDTTVRVWSGINGSHLETLTGHTDSVVCLVASRTNLVFSGSDNKTIMVWRRGPTPTTCIRTLVGHTKAVYSIALSPDHNTLYSGSSDITIRMWSVADRMHLKTLMGHTDKVYSLVVGVDGTVFSGGKDMTVRVWRGSDGKLLHTLQYHKNAVLSLALGPGNTVLSGAAGNDKTSAIWCTHSMTRVGTLKVLPNYVDALAVGPNGMVFAGYRDSGTISVS